MNMADIERVAQACREFRRDEMRRLYAAGATLAQIGNVFGMSRERVRQIIDLGADSGGAAAQKRKKTLATQLLKAKRRDARYLRYYGTDWQTTLNLNGGINPSVHGSKAFIYCSQRRNALTRMIPWAFTFETWLRVWDASGKLDARGRGRDRYVMARINDSGDYSPANVKIVTAVENVRDGYRVRLGTAWESKAWHVLSLKENGLTFKEIGKRLGMKASQANSYSCLARRWRKEGLQPEQVAA